MFSLAYVILPFSDSSPSDAIRDSLKPFQNGTRNTLPEFMLAFLDETEALRKVYEAKLVFTDKGNNGIQIEGNVDTFYLDIQKVRNEMKRIGLPRWHIRFADKMDLDMFVDQFGIRLERHPDTGVFGIWCNPIGYWDWWDLGGRFDGQIIGERQIKPGRSVAELSSGPSRGRDILDRLGDVLADALGQEPISLLEVRNDRNIEMVSTLLEDARKGRKNAYPATIVLPPGSIEDCHRWLTTWPETGPQEAFAWLGLEADAEWKDIVEATYLRFVDHWVAGIAYHH